MPCLITRHLARALAFATQSAMLSCQLVLHAPSFMPFSVPSPSMLTFMDHMLIGLCPHLLLCFIYKTHLLKQFLIEAMDIKQPEAQDLKNLKNYLKLLHLTLLKPHRLHHLLPLRPSLPKNLNLSGNIELLPESLLLQRNPEQTKSFSLHYQLRM